MSPSDYKIYGVKEPLPIEFVNTIYAEKGDNLDALAEAGAAATWLRERRGSFEPPLPAARLAVLDPVQERTLRELRDVARRLMFAAVRGEAPHPWDVAQVNRASSLDHSWTTLSWSYGDDPRVERMSATDALTRAQSELARGVIELVTGQRHLLVACPGPGCVLLFYRHHPRREWCSSGCGNRARVARHYRRHVTDRPDGGPD